MSYQVLARKWRPRIFREMVGQEHVLKALINALDHKRLHHAYLFTGTRGVGKTTIARILAKCLNCETGISSEPCDKCSACIEISEGRFVDLIEVDAASRTKVEDTRELLDNVQYAPTRGRFKIYLIDEVHMLSNHSFNALLKTLEEPPEHVKFLLATTDPQKLPVTILSRCLQFNLKNMSPERIVGHLQFVLEKEVIPTEEQALWLLARSADGSMRDALSLTDQAISFGGGKVVEMDVAAMLGTIDHVLIQNIMQALVSNDGPAILQAVAKFAEHAPDFNAALADLLTLLHRIAIAQALPEALDNSYGDRSQILEFASQLAPQDVQLFYQTALIGRRDLPLSSDPRSGFEMTLLRMLAFKPQGVIDVPTSSLPGSASVGTQGDPASEKKSQAESGRETGAAGLSPYEQKPREQAPREQAPQQGIRQQNQPQASNGASNSKPNNGPKIDIDNLLAEKAHERIDEKHQGEKLHSEKPHSEKHRETPSEMTQQAPAISDTPSEKPSGWTDQSPDERTNDESQAQVSAGPKDLDKKTEGHRVADLKEQVKAIVGKEGLTSKKAALQENTQAKPAEKKYDLIKKIELANVTPESWIPIYLQLDIRGILQSTVSNCVLLGVEGNQLQFLLDEEKASLYDSSHSQRLADALSDYFEQAVKVDVQLNNIPDALETPARYDERIKAEKRHDAIEWLKQNDVIRSLQNEFDGQLLEDTVKF